MNNEYKNEVIGKWSNTNTYQEFHKKTNDYSTEDWNNIGNSMNNIFELFSKNLIAGQASNSIETQKLVLILKDTISNNLYSCTDKILLELGSLYVSDERFTKNIDKYALGNAKYINQAIKYYCKINNL